MFNYSIKAGTTDVSVVLRIIDALDGTPETGVVFNTSGIDLEYRRELAASVDITAATLAALTTAHTDGGFLHIGNGYYRLDLPDAAMAAGATGVLVHGIVTGMVVIGAYIQLIAYDPFDAVRLGLTALPNAVPGAAGGGFIAGTNAPTTITTALTTTFTGNLTGSVGSLAAQAKLDVNAEVVDAVATDVYGEPAQGAPGVSMSLAAKINFLYKAFRNKITQTSTTLSLFADDGSTVDHKATVTDDGATYTRGEISTGP